MEKELEKYIIKDLINIVKEYLQNYYIITNNDEYFTVLSNKKEIKQAIKKINCGLMFKSKYWILKVDQTSLDDLDAVVERIENEKKYKAQRILDLHRHYDF